MSSSYVRGKIKSFLATNLPSEKVVDLSGVSEEIGDLLQDNSIGREAWLGLEFIGDGESPVSVPATNSQGRYREVGAVVLHIVEPSRLGVINAILPRAEAISDIFRGQRIDEVTIEEITPLNTSAGASLTFQRGFTSGTIVLSYQRDRDL